VTGSVQKETADINYFTMANKFSKNFLFRIAITTLFFMFISGCKFKSDNSKNEIESTLEKGLNFLLNKNFDNFGMDYEKQKYPFAIKYPDESDFGKNFVAAFVLDALSPRDKKAIEISKFLKNRRIEKEGFKGMWSFDDHGVSTDADTTLTVLISLINSGSIENNIIEDTYKVIFESYYRSCELVSIVNPENHTNYDTHIEPTANFLLLLSFMNDRKIPFNEGVEKCVALKIIDRLENDGFFHAYWYPSKYFATFLAVRALSSYSIQFNGADKIEPIFSRIRGSLKKSQNADGGWGNKESNPFDTANAIKTLKILNENARTLEKGKRYLAETQNQDGSWNSTVIFNYFYPQCEKRNCPEPWHDVDRKILSTAFAVKALKQ
jgi:hypothetical protein